MRIAYVGNVKNLASDGKPFNTERHIQLSLEKLGHEVSLIQEDEINQPLVDLVDGHDLFLWTRTWEGKVTKEDLRNIERLGIPTVSFHLDVYSNIKRDGGMGIKSAFWDTQHVFSPEGSPQSARIFKEHGINHHYLPAGVFEGECYIADPVPQYRHDIVFVGGGEDYSHPEWAYRGQLVRWLRQTYGDKFAKYGYPQRTVRGKELNQLYSSAKIVIGDSLCKDFMDSYYFSDRIFETTGRGGFTIAPYIAGITDYFVDRKEAVFYSFGNWVQLKNLIDYYLSEEGSTEREQIRKAGHERTKRDHTYTNRVQEMLRKVRI